MLTVIVPSRERPHVVADLVGSFLDTITVSTTRLVIALDHSDPTSPQYLQNLVSLGDGAQAITTIEMVTGGTMVNALNEMAARVVSSRLVEAVGFLGDDHRPRTYGWDACYLTALRQAGAGIVYGDDLLQHAFVPTQCAMSADIVRQLGWMAHPSLRHMYVDTLWRDMAQPVGKLIYLPDVTIEHMHYLNNKAKMDAGYERVNDPEVYRVDEEAFRRLHATGIVRSASETIRRLAVINA
jgi:hypothetical protein